MTTISKGNRATWPCTCVRRDESGNLNAVKAHPMNRKRCRVCGAERPTFGQYYCAACGQLLDRDSDKVWVESYCERSQRFVRIYRV